MDPELDQFLEWQRARVRRRTGAFPSPRTLKRKASALRTACACAGVDGLREMSTLTQDRERVESLLDALALRMTPGSMQAVVTALRDFSEFAKAKGWASGCALVASDRPGANPPKPIVVYTDEELALLVSASRGLGLRWWAFVETLVETGRRVGEVLGLEWAWLNPTAQPPHFHLPTSKNGKQQYVPLSSRLTEVFSAENVEALQREKRVGRNREFARDPQTYVFPFTYTVAERRFRRLCETVGVAPRGIHNIRHTKATALLARGVPPQAVASLLGHTVAVLMRTYDHANALAYWRYLDDGR